MYNHLGESNPRVDLGDSRHRGRIERIDNRCAAAAAPLRYSFAVRLRWHEAGTRHPRYQAPHGNPDETREMRGDLHDGPVVAQRACAPLLVVESTDEPMDLGEFL